MNPPKPHFLLLCEGNSSSVEQSTALTHHLGSAASQVNRWRFVLENVTSGEKFQATDREIGCTLDRASLIAVLRGLEALEQPSKVTLVTNNRYVFRGLQYGLTEWRENDFSWEHFGAIQPIRNADVWRRIDRTLSYHEVQCRWMAIEDGNDNECLPPLHSNTSASSLEEPESTPLESVSEASAKSPSCTELLKPQEESRAIESLVACESESATELIVVPPLAPYVFKDSGIANSFASPPTSTSTDVWVTPTVATTAKVPSETFQYGTIEQNGPDPQMRPTDSPDRLSLRSKLFYPFALGWSLCKSILLACWELVLRLDEGVESYLRCMLLLDPKDRRR